MGAGGAEAERPRLPGLEWDAARGAYFAAARRGGAAPGGSPAERERAAAARAAPRRRGAPARAGPGPGRGALAGLLGAREAGRRRPGAGRAGGGGRGIEGPLRRGLVSERAGELRRVQLAGGSALRCVTSAVQLRDTGGRPEPIVVLAHGFGASAVRLRKRGGRLEGKILESYRGAGSPAAPGSFTDTLDQATAVQQLGPSLLGVAGMGRPGEHPGVQVFDISSLVAGSAGPAATTRWEGGGAASRPRAVAAIHSPDYCSLFDMACLHGSSHLLAVAGSLPRGRGRTCGVSDFYSYDALDRGRTAGLGGLVRLGRVGDLPSDVTAVAEAGAMGSCFLGLRDGSLRLVDSRQGFGSELLAYEGQPFRKAARRGSARSPRPASGGSSAICSLASCGISGPGDVVLGRVDGSVQRLDARARQLVDLGRIGGATGARFRVGYAPEASLAAAQGSDGELHLWNVESGTPACSREGGPGSGATVSAFYRDAAGIISGVLVGNQQGLQACTWSEPVT